MSEMCDLLTVFKNKFRKIENLTKKCVNLEGAIKFNKTCLNNRIYPVHVKINPFPPSVPIWQRLAKVSILILEGTIKKISYERRDYESVDEKSLS